MKTDKPHVMSTQREVWKCEAKSYHIELMTDGKRFAWFRNGLDAVSPVFSTVEAAYWYSQNVDFLTDDEWRDRFPIPGSEDAPTLKHVGNFEDIETW